MILTKLLIVLHRCCRVHMLSNPVLRAHSARKPKNNIEGSQGENEEERWGTGGGKRGLENRKKV